MFSVLVRRDGLIDPPKLGKLDAHCHILPGLDDGPRDNEGSIAIARLLVEMGIEKVVATPHVISDIYSVTTDKIINGTLILNETLAKLSIPLKVLAGAEYYLEKHFLNLIEKDDIVSWGKDKIVMFEASVHQKPLFLKEAVFSLKASGYTPMLAHVERYNFLRNTKNAALALHESGVLFQVNHPSFFLPKTSRKGETARTLYIKGFVNFLGTDMHKAFVAKNYLNRISGKKPFRSYFFR